MINVCNTHCAQVLSMSSARTRGAEDTLSYATTMAYGYMCSGPQLLLRRIVIIYRNRDRGIGYIYSVGDFEVRPEHMRQASQKESVK